MTRQWMMGVLLAATLMSGTALAQSSQDDAAEQPRDVSEMSPEQRMEYWNNLSDADKARVYEMRAQRAGQADAAPMAAGTADKAERYEDLSGSRQQQAKAKWEAMSADERRAFVMEHADEIRAGLAARGGQ